MSHTEKPSMRRPGWIYRWMMSFMGLFDRWLHLSCRTFIHLASAKFERPLTGRERFGQSIHRFICRICHIQETRMEQLNLPAQDLGRNAAGETDVSLSADTLKRIKGAMAQAAETSKMTE